MHFFFIFRAMWILAMKFPGPWLLVRVLFYSSTQHRFTNGQFILNNYIAVVDPDLEPMGMGKGGGGLFYLPFWLFFLLSFLFLLSKIRGGGGPGPPPPSSSPRSATVLNLIRA